MSEPHASNAHRGQIEQSQAKKRQAVFTRRPRTVLIRLLSVQDFIKNVLGVPDGKILPGFREVVRNEAAIEQKHVVLSENRGVDAYAYGRERDTELELPADEVASAGEATEPKKGKADGKKIADSGYNVFEKEQNVFAGELVRGLMRDGYVVRDCHAYFQQDKGAVHVICLVLPDEGEEITPELVPAIAWTLLDDARWNNGTIWANLNEREDGSVFRLDTLNIAKPKLNESKGDKIVRQGNTYRLETVE